MKNFILPLFASLIISSCGTSQENWSHFRGNQLDGHSASAEIPIHFNDSTNVVWKAEIPGLGWSSPVVWGTQIWLTTATKKGDQLSAVCIDYKTGARVKEILIFEPDTIQRIHATNSFATPTPCIEDGFVYLHYGSYGTACVNTRNFSVVWKRTDMKCQHMQGAASSVVLYKNLLIVHIEGTDVQYLAALDKATGETIWKTERPQQYYTDIAPVYRKAYTTPLIVNVDGKDQLISNGAQLCIAYEPETGKEIWQLFYGHDSTVGMPLAWGGLVFFNSGWIFMEDRPNFVKFYAVDPKGRGDIEKTHLKWQLEEDVPQISTPVIVEGKIYMVHERGAITCVDAMTGHVDWKDKLDGQFNASPVFAAGSIIVCDVKGKIYLLKPGNHFQVIAENQLGGTIKATPAIVNNNILVRTENHLFRFGK